MNQNELNYFQRMQLRFYDITALPLSVLLEAIILKIRRRTWGKIFDKGSRLVWTPEMVSDAVGPFANVRDYRERRTIRLILNKVRQDYPINSASEVGCGYGTADYGVRGVCRESGGV